MRKMSTDEMRKVNGGYRARIYVGGRMNRVVRGLANSFRVPVSRCRR